MSLESHSAVRKQIGDAFAVASITASADFNASFSHDIEDVVEKLLQVEIVIGTIML